MTKLETLPLSQECLEGLAEAIAKFFAPDEDDEPSTEKPRKISPEIADRLQIELKVLDQSSANQEPSDSNEECLNELTALMTKYLNEHNIPPETVTSFPNEKCLNELANVISEFFIQYNVPPETVGSLQIDIKEQSETQQGIIAVTRLGCIPGGPPHAPCPGGKKFGIIP